MDDSLDKEILREVEGVKFEKYSYLLTCDKYHDCGIYVGTKIVKYVRFSEGVENLIFMPCKLQFKEYRNLFPKKFLDKVCSYSIRECCD